LHKNYALKEADIIRRNDVRKWLETEIKAWLVMQNKDGNQFLKIK
jgi:hypothetical protein